MVNSDQEIALFKNINDSLSSITNKIQNKEQKKILNPKESKKLKKLLIKMNLLLIKKKYFEPWAKGIKNNNKISSQGNK